MGGVEVTRVKLSVWLVLRDAGELADLGDAVQCIAQQIAYGANCAQGTTAHLLITAERMPVGVHFSVGLR